MSKEEMIAAIKASAEKLGRAPTTRELYLATGRRLSRAQVSKRFGTYTRALNECGLTRHDGARPHSMMELFLAWATVARKVKRVPTTGDYRQEGTISDQCLARRFGRWGGVHAGMLKFLEREKLEGEWGDVAEIIRQHGRASAVVPRRAAAPTGSASGEQIAAQIWATTRELTEQNPPPMDGRPFYGEPIPHPAMCHAPANENGVMVLFGAMAPALGFVITRVQAGFPDCEALRRMRNGRLQRVLIEFEYESRNFSLHLHDPAGCDLIVCWVHNWKECPLEVIELSRIIGGSRIVPGQVNAD
ncbi:MAG: homing endonuclease associated repeat-containing protein [Actinomycetota bacterium]